jgi:hypothetical protein
MPRAKAPLKSTLLKKALADSLKVPVADILTRPQVVDEFGKELGYTNEKSLSNAGLKAPCFYLAPLGQNGLALYSRAELTKWLCEPKARRDMENLKELGRPYPWPNPPLAAQAPPPTDSEAFLDALVKSAPEVEQVAVREHIERMTGARSWD